MKLLSYQLQIVTHVCTYVRVACNYVCVSRTCVFMGAGSVSGADLVNMYIKANLSLQLA